MDDVEDSSELRRGIPVAHKIYGVPQTINTANYVYFLAMQELYRFRSSAVAKNAEQGRKEDDKLDEVITGEQRRKRSPTLVLMAIHVWSRKEELLQLHRGQGLDLFWRDTLTCPTEEEYVGMVLGSKHELVTMIKAGMRVFTRDG
jgi:geranylgeranyl diphosphate synthase type 3